MQDLRIDEAARALRLTVAQLRQLEKDDYSEMAGITYVRGYLRTYARLLKVSVDDEIHASEILSDQGPAEILLSDQTLRPKQKQNIKWLPIFIVPLLILTTGWFVLNNTSFSKFKENLVNVVGMGDVDGNIRADGQDNSNTVISFSDIGEEQETVSVSDKAIVQKLDDQQVIELATLGDASQMGSENQELVSTDSQAFTSDRQLNTRLASAGFELSIPGVVSSVNERQKEDDSQLTTLVPNANDRRRLVMYFDDDSWADVRDRDDRKLLYQTVDSGRVILLEGEPPFRVFLGNAKAVRVQYNGQFEDFATQTSGLFARFSVGSLN